MDDSPASAPCPETPAKALVCWSGGKDSALALHEAARDTALDVVGLLSTVTADYGRISMHGVRRELLQQQADSLRLPLRTVSIPRNSSAEEYDEGMARCLRAARDEGVRVVMFGDIHLAQVRQYREERMNGTGIRPVFPLWGRDTRELTRLFVRLGFKATVTCVDTTMLAAQFAGRDLDSSFFESLPVSADPCGENGEYHTFVWDGPVFSRPVAFDRGETVLREHRFCYCDLLPAGTRAEARCHGS
jgi:uncharacterized protein (TIGR00290 family)